MFRGPILNTRAPPRVSPRGRCVGWSAPRVSMEALVFVHPLVQRYVQALVLSQVAPRVLQTVLEQAVLRVV